MPLSAKTRDKLKTVSTATIATALYKRGFRIQMIQGVQPLDPAKPTMVGEAFTLRYIPAREDLNPITVFQDRGHSQRKGIEDCPPAAVFAIDSRKVVTEKVHEGRSITGLYPSTDPQTKADFDVWRKAKGR